MSAHSHSRIPLVVLGAVVLAVGWLGCAGGDEEGGGVDPGPSPTSATSTSKPEPTTRPDFEAGFVEPDASIDDPTPDGGDTCVDKNDVGGNEALAKALPDTNDGVDTPSTVQSVLNGAVDVDYYKLKMSDVSSGVTNADIQNKTAGVELCAFVKCASGTTTINGCTGGVVTSGPIGMKGCCTTGISTASPDWNCPGINDSVEIYFRVKQTAATCKNYSFSYVF